jgi:hypothetical protein
MLAKKKVTEVIKELKKLPQVTIHLSEESTIKEKLLKVGIHQERLLAFMKRNAEHNREILELRKDTISNEAYYKEKLELNEVDIFILYLENSL